MSYMEVIVFPGSILRHALGCMRMGLCTGQHDM